MEVYQIFSSIYSVLGEFLTADLKLLMWCAVAGVAIWLGLFLLQGFGLFAMAKNRGMKKRWLAFLPFVNLWYVGKIVGECTVFGQRMKRAGVYAMIAQILTTLACFLTIGSQVYLMVEVGAPSYDQFGLPYWTGLTGFGAVAYKTFNVVSLILPIFQLIYEVLLIILLVALLKKYAPGNYFILSMLCLFVPYARYIVIFVLRKRSAIDYEAYMRARREAYMRQQQQYNGYNGGYGNSYGNPYGRPNGNPYTENGAKNESKDEPFSEFSGGDKKKNEKDTDGFFD